MEPQEIEELMERPSKLGNVKRIPGGISYDGQCPECGGHDMKDKGSFDKCMSCGLRIGADYLGSS